MSVFHTWKLLRALRRLRFQLPQINGKHDAAAHWIISWWICFFTSRPQRASSAASDFPQTFGSVFCDFPLHSYFFGLNKVSAIRDCLVFRVSRGFRCETSALEQPAWDDKAGKVILVSSVSKNTFLDTSPMFSSVEILPLTWATNKSLMLLDLVQLLADKNQTCWCLPSFPR